MAYENVDVDQLRSSLNACKSALDCSTSQGLINGISDTIWSGKAKTNLTTAISKLTNTRYNDLKNKINEYLKVVDQIESYKSLSTTSGSLRSQKSTKEYELRMERQKAKPNKTRINQLQNEINSLNSQINSADSQMNSISISI